MDILEQITQEAKKAGEFITEKAVIVKDYTVATWDAAEIRNRIEGLYKSIGKAMYLAHTTEADTAEEIDGYITELISLNEALKEKEAERQAIRNRKVCPACDKPIEKGNIFCPHCGTQVK